jgi:hypothetical protein
MRAKKSARKTEAYFPDNRNLITSPANTPARSDRMLNENRERCHSDPAVAGEESRSGNKPLTRFLTSLGMTGKGLSSIPPTGR